MLIPASVLVPVPYLLEPPSWVAGSCVMWAMGSALGRRGCGRLGVAVTFGDVSWWANGWLGGLWGAVLRGSRRAVEQRNRSVAHSDRMAVTGQ